jgi:hypothetical protein
LAVAFLSISFFVHNNNFISKAKIVVQKKALKEVFLKRVQNNKKAKMESSGNRTSDYYRTKNLPERFDNPG